MNIEALLEVMSRLRDPDNGCPWDIQQSFHTIYPYTIEEAYEVADAIERGDLEELKDELGDLLFQVVFHSQMAKEQGGFEFQDVVAAIVDKMISRHPHVFADVQIADAEAQTEAWEHHKAKERALKSKQQKNSSLDGVTLGLPALLRAQKLQKRAAKTGFDWTELEGVIGKVYEELEELKIELGQPAPEQKIEEELGDLLFSCVNLARHLGLDAEQALYQSNRKFERRFRSMEDLASKQSVALQELPMEQLDQLWDKVKEREL